MNIQDARDYAIKCHHKTNHIYGNGLPYSIHLKMVSDIANIFHELIPDDYLIDVFAACWCHDLIEDCRETYNDVKSQTNERVADIVYALTNEKGKNRKERASDKYYEGIVNTPYATFVKLCDRIANVSYSKSEGSSMFEMYKKENESFCFKLNAIYDGIDYSEMFNYLNSLFK